MTHAGVPPVVDPTQVYRQAQQLDGMPLPHEGTSVRAGAQVLQQLGYIESYYWAMSLEDIVQALLDKGPVLMGTHWYTDMLRPANGNTIKATGYSIGGHAYLLNGVNVPQRMFRLKNSWGRAWGDRGHAWIGFDHIQRLLSQDGEACLAVEKQK